MLFDGENAIEHSSNTEHETDVLRREFNSQLLSLVGLLHVQCENVQLSWVQL